MKYDDRGWPILESVADFPEYARGFGSDANYSDLESAFNTGYELGKREAAGPPKYIRAGIAMESPGIRYRDAALDYTVGERVHTMTGMDLTFAEIEAMVQSGDLQGVSPVKLANALGMSIDGYWTDINEGFSKNRGTLQEDHEDVDRIQKLLNILEPQEVAESDEDGADLQTLEERLVRWQGTLESIEAEYQAISDHSDDEDRAHEQVKKLWEGRIASLESEIAEARNRAA